MVDQQHDEKEKERRAAITTPGARSAPLDAGSVKPTPTQEENDAVATGTHDGTLEADGSPTDDAAMPPGSATQSQSQSQHQTRQAEAKPAPKAGYQTRAANPSPSTSS
jgi:hypothetical protein